MRIDISRILKNKTKGNITDREQLTLRGVVSELQLQFLKAQNRKREMEDSAAQSDYLLKKDKQENVQKERKQIGYK